MITYQARGRKTEKTIYLRFRTSNNDLLISTGKKTKYWKGGWPTEKTAESKNIKYWLQDLEKHLKKEISGVTNKDELTGGWFKNQIAKFNLKLIEKKIEDSESKFDKTTLQSEATTLKKKLGVKTEKELPQDVHYWIQHRIDNPTYRNRLNEIKRLSKGRLRHYRNLGSLVKDFEEYIETTLNVADCNQSIFDEFLNYLYDEEDMTGQTSAKRASDLKTVCRYAKTKGVNVSDDFDTISFGGGKTYDNDMDVIYLSFDEISKIQSLDLQDGDLINARKWLIALCYTGQRGGDLIGNTSKGTKSQLNHDRLTTIEGNLVLKVSQEKGNKNVNVPVLPPVQELFDNGLPPQMPLQKVRRLFKEIGKLAVIDEPTNGRKIEKTDKGKRGVKKVRPKYEYLSTHTGRRSFATNFENDTDMPRVLIMNITGHTKESTFLKYINKATDTHVEKTFEAYAKAMAKQKAKSSNKAPMHVLKTGTDE